MRALICLFVFLLAPGLGACGGSLSDGTFFIPPTIPRIDASELATISPAKLTYCCDPDGPAEQSAGTITVTLAEGVIRLEGIPFGVRLRENGVQLDRIDFPEGLDIRTRTYEVFVDCANEDDGLPEDFDISLFGTRANPDFPGGVGVFESSVVIDLCDECDQGHAERFANDVTQVFGQEDGVSGEPNQGGDVAADTLNMPLGNVDFDESLPGIDTTMWVADSINHRVIGFELTASGLGSDGSPFRLLLGQTAEDQSQPAAGLRGLNTPVSISINNGLLLMTDSGNNRAFAYLGLPLVNGEIPDVVLGQDNFTTTAPAAGAAGLNGPSAISVGGTFGRVAIADTLGNRVKLYNGVPTMAGAPADVILGQPDADSTAPGSGRGGMRLPQGVFTDGTVVVVSDTGNDRVLIWNTWPTTDGQLPDTVIGQPDFDSTGPQPPERGLNKPMGVDVKTTPDGTVLGIADSGNNRAVMATGVVGGTITPDRSWDFVIGQASLTNTAPNDDDQDGVEDPTPSRRTLKQPQGVRFFGDDVLVTDTENHRAVRFQLRVPRF